MTSFKIDENLPREVAGMLRSGGYDAVTALDEALGGHADTELSLACKAEGRALVTLDLDFSNVRVYPPEAHPGIVVLRLTSQDKPKVLEIVARLIPMLATQTLTGQLWIVEPDRVRIWQGRT